MKLYQKKSLDYMVFVLSQNNADIMFGGVTVVSGILGTIAGGFLLDRMTSTISNAFKVNMLAGDRLTGHVIVLWLL